MKWNDKYIKTSNIKVGDIVILTRETGHNDWTRNNSNIELEVSKITNEDNYHCIYVKLPFDRWFFELMEEDRDEGYVECAESLENFKKKM